MKFFRSRRFDASSQHRQIYSLYEIAYTTIDWLAAMLFITGSILFLYPELKHIGTWFFIVGSVCFALRPTIRLGREFHLAGLGDIADEKPDTHEPENGQGRIIDNRKT